MPPRFDSAAGHNPDGTRPARTIERQRPMHRNTKRAGKAETMRRKHARAEKYGTATRKAA